MVDGGAEAAREELTTLLLARLALARCRREACTVRQGAHLLQGESVGREGGADGERRHVARTDPAPVGLLLVVDRQLLGQRRLLEQRLKQPAVEALQALDLLRPDPLEPLIRTALSSEFLKYPLTKLV